MGRREEYRDELAGLAPQDVRAFLVTRSGLPGPRANLELVHACADVLGADLARALTRDHDEYVHMCGVVTLGRVLGEAVDDSERAAVEAALAEHARDERWRIREAVATALQRSGDVDPARLRDVVTRWLTSRDPLVLRAAVAGVCEPRLLADRATAELALTAVGSATDALAALQPGERRRTDVRTLRQALGYCWSVAVAADPERGVPLFDLLRTVGDPDVTWVVRENLGKARLRRLLPERSGGRGSDT